MTASQHKSNDHNRRAPRACGCCLLTPLVLALALFAAYKIDNIDPQITLPTHAMPDDNARDYFHRAHLASKLMKHMSPYDMSTPPAQSNTLANFKGCAVDAEPALKIMREGLNHPYMNPPDRSLKSNTFTVFAEFRDLERVNAGAADYYAVTGDPGRSMQMRLDGLEMGAMIPKGGVMISALVGIACEAMAESRMEPLIPQLSSAELARAASRLDRIAAKRVPYSEILLEEGYTQAAYLMETLKLPESKANPYRAALSLFGGDQDDGTDTWRERISVRLDALKFTMENKSKMLQENLAWYAAMSTEARGQFNGPSKVKAPKNLMAEMVGSIGDITRQRCVSMDASIDLLRVEVALCRYKKANGKYPATLADLVPKYLPTVPVDPCGGGPLHYGLKDDGTDVLLYSIGPDMQDNLGVPGSTLGSTPGDIVAGKLYRKGPILATRKAN